MENLFLLGFNCSDPELIPLFGIINTVYTMIIFAVPIVLIIFSSIDFAKAMAKSEDKEIKNAQALLVKRFVALVIVLLIYFFLKILLTILSPSNETGDSIIGNETKNNIMECLSQVFG
ncbi:MAG: hypothetical protein ACK5NF_06935 [Bacilli bacterium]